MSLDLNESEKISKIGYLIVEKQTETSELLKHRSNALVLQNYQLLKNNKQLNNRLINLQKQRESISNELVNRKKQEKALQDKKMKR